MLGERRKYLSKINCEYLSSISCVTFNNENFQKINPTRVYHISSNTVEPPNSGRVGTSDNFLYSEVAYRMSFHNRTMFLLSV